VEPQVGDDTVARIDDLRRRLEHNDEVYGARFAGMSRATRSLAELDDLIATAQELAAEAQTLPPAVAKELYGEAQAQLERLRGERTAIAQVQAQPGAVQASELGTRANIVFHRYARHFAGQSRATRDASLLRDMLTELDGVAAEMQALYANRPLSGLKSDIEVVQGRQAQFRDELRAIGQARTEVSPEQQAAALADEANQLFGQYRTHFAGLPRVTRRPELLVRLIGALEEVRDRMAALTTQGLRDEHNDGNQQIVRDRLAAWQTELAAVRKERQAASLTSMVAELGTAANAELEGYGQHFAGQSRKTRDLARLSAIVDRLDEVHRQMLRLAQVQSSPDHDRNLGIVRDSLVRYMAEYDAIRELQSPEDKPF
jgi:hypothetical protein